MTSGRSLCRLALLGCFFCFDIHEDLYVSWGEEGVALLEFGGAGDERWFGGHLSRFPMTSAADYDSVNGMRTEA